MDAIECILTRRSIRSFKAESIPHETIEKIVAAAAYAPSWKHGQIARYTVVEDRELINRLADEAVCGFELNAKTMKKAPAVVLVTYIQKRSGFERDGSFSTTKGDRWEMFDAGIATQTFCLAAHAEGVGTVVQGIFDEEIVRQIVPFDENQTLAAILAIGIPTDTEVVAPKRKAVSDLVRFV